MWPTTRGHHRCSRKYSHSLQRCTIPVISHILYIAETFYQCFFGGKSKSRTIAFDMFCVILLLIFCPVFSDSFYISFSSHLLNKIVIFVCF